MLPRSRCAAAPTDALSVESVAGVAGVAEATLACAPTPCSLASASELTLSLVFGASTTGSIAANSSLWVWAPYFRNLNAMANATLFRDVALESRPYYSHSDLAPVYGALDVPATLEADAVAANASLAFRDAGLATARFELVFREALAPTSLSLVIPRASRIALPERGLYEADAIVAALRAPGYAFGATAVAHFCGGICDVSLSFGDGARGNVSTAVVLSFSTHADVRAGDAFRLRLGGFRRAEASGRFVLAGTARTVFSQSPTWDAGDQVLELVAVRDVDGGADSATRYIVTVSAEAGDPLIFPDGGVDDAAAENVTFAHNMTSTGQGRGTRVMCFSPFSRERLFS